MNKAKKLLEYLSTAYHHNIGDGGTKIIKERGKGHFLDLEWKPKLGKLGLRYVTQSQINLMHQLTKEAGLPLPKGGGTLYVKKGEEYEKLRDVAIKYGVYLGMGDY